MNGTEEKYTEQEVLFFVKDNKGNLVEQDIEKYKNTCFYDLLNKIKNEFETVELDKDVDYVLSFFNKYKATNYIDIYECSEIDITNLTLCEDSGIHAKIKTFELSADLIFTDLLSLEGLDELYDESFLLGLDKFVQASLIDKLYFQDAIKSINATRELVGNSEHIHINRINKHHIFNVYLEALNDTKITFKVIDGLKIAYVRGITSRNRTKTTSFFEDDEGNNLLAIVKTDKNYSIKDIKKIFDFDEMIKAGKVIVGISNIEVVKSILE